jgi:hypothetical protein
MATVPLFKTMNPLPSTSPKDLSDNSQFFDNIANGDAPSYPDRFGKRRESIAGMNKSIADAIIAAGYEYIGLYDSGPLTISRPNQIFSKNGEYWKPAADLALPYTTVSNWTADQPKFRSVGDAVLRQALASAVSGQGASLVEFEGRTVDDKLKDEVWVSDFPGYDPTGASDSWPAFNAAKIKAATAFPFGARIRIPDGYFWISGGNMSNDRASNPTWGRIDWVGSSQNGTRILYTGAPNACFESKGDPNGTGEPNASHELFSDMTILGPSKRVNSTGISLDLCSFARVERCNIQNFDYGWYFQDVDQFNADTVLLRFNNKGFFARKNPLALPASTQPNNWTFKAVTVANNSEYGGLSIGGSAFTYLSGDVEYNGSGPTNWGLKFLDMGYEGATGVSINPGVYFEGNRGAADVFIEAQTVNSTPLLGCTHFVGGNFKRLSGAQNTTNHIVMAVGPAATVGLQRLVTQCGFKEYPGYTPSGASKKIAFALQPADYNNYADLGSGWGSPVEKPDFVQSVVKYDGLVTRSTNQAIASGSTATWALDTVVAPFPIWNPTLFGQGFVIPETGNYTVSAFVVFDSAAPGAKTVLINAGAATVGVGGTATNVASAHATRRFTAGTVITVQVNQATGGTINIVGSAGSQSGVTIVKNCD